MPANGTDNGHQGAQFVVETLRKSVDPDHGIYYTITPQPDGSVAGRGDCSHYNVPAADVLPLATSRADDLIGPAAPKLQT